MDQDLLQTRQRILESAQLLIQTRGYDAFSFADIEERVGIRKASIHYYFPTKAHLGAEVVKQFRANCQSAFKQIEESKTSAHRQLKAYTDLFIAALGDQGRMCLCGILASSFSTLPEPVTSELRESISDHHKWLTGVFDRGLREGSIRRTASAKVMAEVFFATLEGAMLLVRVRGGTASFRTQVKQLLSDIQGN